MFKQQFKHHYSTDTVYSLNPEREGWQGRLMNRANSSCNSVMSKDNNFRDNMLDNNSVLHVHIFSYLKGVYIRECSYHEEVY